MSDEIQAGATAPFKKPSTRGVTAVLGPTNTGKTHYAVTRMLAYETGMIGLPLRLLAREVYDRVVEEKGVTQVALITGEEKILPDTATYFICTVESMPVDKQVDFLAIDEIQLCSDPERGHVFTERLLYARGSHETLLLGAESMRALIKHLLGDVEFLTRARFSELKYAGPKKISRLPRRSAIVAFSTDAVYGIAELIRRQRGGAAVVMGALSPRTRNAQVELYQSGDVDFLVATDAIGMGLNMDVDHVAFASRQKFDGRNMRALRAHEVGQIAGRAGRYTSDGTFGTTGDCGDFEPDLIEQIESHRFDPVRAAQWRNNELDFSSVEALVASLEANPPEKMLMRTRNSTDLVALQRLASEADVGAVAATEDEVRRLWQVCQIPDFRNISPEEHAQLLLSIFRTLKDNGDRLPDDFLEEQIKRVDRTDGDIDAISARITHVRTWTFVSNRAGWIEDARGWQDRTRDVEDKLSDALHGALTQRFIDRRTSVLMKRLHQDEELAAEIDNEGEVTIEGEFVGKLHGFRFVADPRARGLDAKLVRRAADKAVRAMMAARAETLLAQPDTAFKLTDHGRIWWDGHPVARLEKGTDTLAPRVVTLADDLLDVAYRDRIQVRLAKWLEDHVGRILTPLLALRDAATAKAPSADEPKAEEAPKPEGQPAQDAAPALKPNDPRAKPAPTAASVVGGAVPLTGLARGIGFQLVENFGVIDRRANANDIRSLEQSDRAQLRRFGVRFGEFSLFIPSMLKPSPAELLGILWAVWNERISTEAHPETPAPTPPAPGLTSVIRDQSLPNAFYSAAGFRVCGPRAVRIDMLERLGTMIRDARTPDKPNKLEKPAEAPKVEVELKNKPGKLDQAKAGQEQPTEEAPAPAEAAPVEAESADAQPTEEKRVIPAGMFEITGDMMSIVGCSGEEFEGILRGLGLKPHTIREDGKEDLVVWRNAPRRQKHDGRKGGRAQADGENRGRGQRQGKGHGKGKGKGGPPRGPKGGPRGGKPRGPRKEKQPDPDSPFAVLAALKDNMK